MSQRTPSHCAPSVRSSARTASRSPGENALSCTTSGQAGKYGSRPRATIAARRRSHEAGSRARSSSVPRMKYSGCRRQPRVVGRDVVGDVVEDQLQPARGERAPAPPPGRRSARRRRSRARSTASRSRPRRAGRAAPSASRHQARVARARSPAPPGCAPTRPSARRRRRPAAKSQSIVGEPPAAEQHGGVDLVDPHPAIRSTVATAPVQPVWWLAPRPAPLSPWKYSWNRIRSRQCGSFWNFSSPP